MEELKDFFETLVKAIPLHNVEADTAALIRDALNSKAAKAIEAIAALSAARDAVVACHAELAKDHRRMGYGVYNVGPLDKPDNGDWGQGVPPPPPSVEQKLTTVRPIRAA